MGNPSLSGEGYIFFYISLTIGISKQCPSLWVLQGKRLVTNFAPTTSEKTLVCGRICGACNHKKKC